MRQERSFAGPQSNRRNHRKRPFGIVQKSRDFCNEQIAALNQRLLANFALLGTCGPNAAPSKTLCPSFGGEVALRGVLARDFLIAKDDLVVVWPCDWALQVLSQGNSCVGLDQKIPEANTSYCGNAGLDQRQLSQLRIREHVAARQKTQTLGRLEGKAAATAGNNIDDELGMLPIFELRGANVERNIADRAEPHVATTGPKLTRRIAHGGRPVTTAAGLMKHEWAVPALQLLNERESCWRGDDAFDHYPLLSSSDGAKLAPAPPNAAQKKPRAFGL